VGQFVIGLLDADPVACGGWRRIGPGVVEIKRMYVAERARRRGLGRAILADLERRAQHAGIRRLVLNTGPQQPEAIALYESSGYRPTDGFGHYACTPGALFYAKDDTQGAKPG
jgi:GNAT superfamily N-acetyltransferase